LIQAKQEKVLKGLFIYRECPNGIKNNQQKFIKKDPAQQGGILFYKQMRKPA
jgi:hypothetical protein